MARPILIVGDIQGDHERLTEALATYPEDDVDTIFLGDFFQGGELGGAGGVAAARVARDRRNARHVLGNHDLFIITVLEARRGRLDPNTLFRGRSRTLEQFWLDRRGDPADLEALAADPALEQWLRSRPLMLQLDDGTLVQHTDDDAYLKLGTTVVEINERARDLMTTAEGLYSVHFHLVGRQTFDDDHRLDAYLRHFDAPRLVHGHTPHWHDAPDVRHGGRLIGFDGRFSRYWGRTPEQVSGPVEATVALLPPL